MKVDAVAALNDQDRAPRVSVEDARETGSRVHGGERLAAGQLSAAAIATAYTALASVVVWTRLVGLERSFWYDEILTVTEYVRAGPREILSGPYLPNNHELFSVLGWATTSTIGESEVALRLWSAIPFLLGVILVTAWLHIRVNPLSGVFFLYFATTSPLLFDVSRQARGYGLAFLAMSVLVVSAFEAERTDAVGHSRPSALPDSSVRGLSRSSRSPISPQPRSSLHTADCAGESPLAWLDRRSRPSSGTRLTSTICSGSPDSSTVGKSHG